MTFDNATANWIKDGGEVDLPRDPDNWHNLAYRSIRWNAESKHWEYLTRLPKSEIHYSYRKLSDLIPVTNSIHKIDDEVTTDL